jgi:hypothetical protein
MDKALLAVGCFDWVIWFGYEVPQAQLLGLNLSLPSLLY